MRAQNARDPIALRLLLRYAEEPAEPVGRRSKPLRSTKPRERGTDVLVLVGEHLPTCELNPPRRGHHSARRMVDTAAQTTRFARLE